MCTHTHTPFLLPCLFFCLWGNLFWSRCHIASSNINRLDCTALCLLNNVCWIMCAASSYPRVCFKTHHTKTLRKGNTSCALGNGCRLVFIHVYLWACVCVCVTQSICVAVVTHLSIDKALARSSFCPGLRVNTPLVSWNICLISASFFPISAPFSLCLPPPPPSLDADPDFGIQCCYGNNVGLVLPASPSCSSYSE